MLHFFCFVAKDECLAEKDKALLQSLMFCTSCLCSSKFLSSTSISSCKKEFSLFDHWTESKKGAEYRILMFVKLLVFGRASKVAPFNVFWFPPLSALDNNKFSISGKREDGKINSQRSSTIPGSLLHIIFQLSQLWFPLNHYISCWPSFDQLYEEKDTNTASFLNMEWDLVWYQYHSSYRKS